MYKISEPDLDETLASLDDAIEEFHRIRDAMRLSTGKDKMVERGAGQSSR